MSEYLAMVDSGGCRMGISAAVQLSQRKRSLANSRACRDNGQQMNKLFCPIAPQTKAQMSDKQNNYGDARRLSNTPFRTPTATATDASANRDTDGINEELTRCVHVECERERACSITQIRYRHLHCIGHTVSKYADEPIMTNGQKRSEQCHMALDGVLGCSRRQAAVECGVGWPTDGTVIDGWLDCRCVSLTHYWDSDFDF